MRLVFSKEFQRVTIASGAFEMFGNAGRSKPTLFNVSQDLDLNEPQPKVERLDRQMLHELANGLVASLPVWYWRLRRC
jgi:hypothetical protein